MLKPQLVRNLEAAKNQPPSGGCVLKPCAAPTPTDAPKPAAFRRLCVETPVGEFPHGAATASRLQAAVC